MNAVRGLAALVLGCVGLVALAPAAVYRCGPDGRSYSQQPCPEGRVVDVDDARAPDQRADTASGVRRAAALARDLERERLQAESRPVRAVSLSAPRRGDAKAARGESAKSGARGQARAKPRPRKPSGPPRVRETPAGGPASR